MRVTLGIAAIALAVVVGLGTDAVAHHAFSSEYDEKNVVTITGTITKYEFKNPHVYITWDAKDDKGTIVNWTGELSSPPTMISEGLSRDTFKPGDPLTVTFMPTKAGTPQGLVIKIVRPDGKVVLDLSERRGLLEQ